jgi:hypothetical protein
MIPGPVLIIRSFLVTFMFFYFQYLNPKITKIFVTHFALDFVKLRVVGV